MFRLACDGTGMAANTAAVVDDESEVGQLDDACDRGEGATVPGWGPRRPLTHHLKGSTGSAQACSDCRLTSDLIDYQRGFSGFRKTSVQPWAWMRPSRTSQER